MHLICNSTVSIVPPGRDQILNTNTGDKSPAYFLVVPPGHIGTATALNAEMPKLQSQALACVGFPGGERPEGGLKMRQLHRRFDFLRSAFCGRYGPKGSPHSATPEFLDFPFLLNRAEG
jgi:hypothetical protein